jgi:HD-GYP domain-containing protein (c-di-GMP phosphodiesterase class II)
MQEGSISCFFLVRNSCSNRFIFGHAQVFSDDIVLGTSIISRERGEPARWGILSISHGRSVIQSPGDETLMETREGLCRAIREDGLLVHLLDGDLQTSDENRVLTHLRTCHECLGVVADLLYTDTRLKDLFSRDNLRRSTEKREEKRNSQYFMLEVDKLPAGKAIERDLLDENGTMLVAGGTILTPALIESIKRRGIDKLAVRTAEEEAKPRPSEPEIPAVSVREVEAFFADAGVEPAVSQVVRSKCRDAMENCFRRLEEDGVCTLNEADASAAEIANEILSKPSLAPSLCDLILVDPSLHSHSVNVLVIFLMLARAMGHPAQLVKDHASGALLHDIGRIVLRQPELRGGPALTPEEEDQRHAEAGYSYLWNAGGFGQSALKMVMNHHERYDGKGYPRGLKGTILSDWDQLLILANTFDNMTWNRETGVRSGFHQALTSLIQDGSKYVRKGIVSAVIQTFGYYPPGSWIRLSNGEIGIVSKAHPGSPLKPTVAICYDEGGRRLTRPRFVDLSDAQTAYIQGPVTVETVP